MKSIRVEQARAYSDHLALIVLCIVCVLVGVIGSVLIRRWRLRRRELQLQVVGGKKYSRTTVAQQISKGGRRRSTFRAYMHKPPTKKVLRPSALRRYWREPMVKVLVIAIPLLALTFVFEDALSKIGRRPLNGRVTHVRDGDTIEVNGTPIRFANLDCAELGTLPGDKAKRAMLSLASGKRVECSLTGAKSYDRFIGECELEDGTDLSRAMVRGGFCRWWR